MSADHALRVTALDRLLEVTLLLRQDLDRALPALGLTESRVKVVWHLHQHGPCTQSTLAEALAVAPRSVTALVDALADTGFVTRERHPHDRRATLVTLTDHGARVASGLADGQAELADQLFGDLAGSRLTGFVAALDGVASRLRTLVEEASS